MQRTEIPGFSHTYIRVPFPPGSLDTLSSTGNTTSHSKQNWVLSSISTCCFHKRVKSTFNPVIQLDFLNSMNSTSEPGSFHARIQDWVKRNKNGHRFKLYMKMTKFNHKPSSSSSPSQTSYRKINRFLFLFCFVFHRKRKIKGVVRNHSGDSEIKTFRKHGNVVMQARLAMQLNAIISLTSVSQKQQLICNMTSESRERPWEV